jgi:predicted Zn-dependent protease
MGILFGRRRPPEPPDDRGPFGRRPGGRREDPYGQGGSLPPELDPERRRGGRAYERTGDDGGRPPSRGLGGGKGRLLLALAIVAIPAFKFLSSCQENPHTGRRQSVSMTAEQEIQLGLQAAPELIQQHRGRHPDPSIREAVEIVGERIVRANELDKTPYQWTFHALADPEVINAFALPGGQVFITDALMRALAEDGGNVEARIAGVLGHEVGHVVGRHGAERMSKMQLMQGITGAVLVATYDPNNANSQQKAAMAMMIGNLINMKWGREQELESDRLGVQYMIRAGYHPEAMIDVMNVLEARAGGGKAPEMFSTHPKGERRREEIREAIEAWIATNGPLPTDLKR